MKRQSTEVLIQFLRHNLDSLKDNIYGIGYRASVYLIDGTFLPRVIFRNSKAGVDLAIRSFNEEQTGKSIFSRQSGIGYYEAVKTFVASGISYACQGVKPSFRDDIKEFNRFINEILVID